MGASFGDATEGASLPAQSVSTAARGTRGPARTILTAAPLAARARDTARSRRSARPARGGGGAAAAARSGRGRGRPAAHPGRAARRGLLGSGPARVRGSRGAARAPPSRRPRFRVAHAPFVGREETLPSQLCGIRLPCRADVSRMKAYIELFIHTRKINSFFNPVSHPTSQAASLWMTLSSAPSKSHLSIHQQLPESPAVVFYFTIS
ncbi:translation initiation factor IF-2-like isoform X3 [Balaenoptera musculus]|uniref:Translation initiation factor IF-2-like isoform X3 n=1 Tax=Balaenoptera musculus TaxID=9771 RepID=A0A8B8WYT4_BALMU|nr:translation initiation factor IF-2-like isoform X3 [Balaenoptera musculus]